MAFAESELSSLKKLRETGITDRQLGSGRPRTSRTAENIDVVDDLVLSQVVHQGHTKLPVRSLGNWHFVDVSGTYHTQRHSAKVPEETSRAGVNCVEQSFIDQAILRSAATSVFLMRVKVKCKHIERLL